MQVTIYHNPRCSKSRQTLALLEDRGISPTVVEYLKTPPNAATIVSLLKMLELAPRQLMRKGEAVYKEQQLDNPALTEQALVQAMHEHPKLIERPIVVVDGKQAAIGRPPEQVLGLIA